MGKLYITLSKKTLAIVLAVMVIGILLSSLVLSADTSKLDGFTNQKRVEYINSLGITVGETPITSKEIVIPEKFSQVYENYNKIQNKAGFDLSLYKGKKAQIYSYAVEGGEKVVNLLICGKKIIGGDISSSRIDGEMLPLKKIDGDQKNLSAFVTLY